MDFVSRPLAPRATITLNYFKPTLCVPFVEENSDIMARKFADEGKHEMMHFEGKAVNWIIGESFNK